MNIEGYLNETWRGSNGNIIASLKTVAVATGYPKKYNLKYAQNQYLIYAEAQNV